MYLIVIWTFLNCQFSGQDNYVYWLKTKVSSEYYIKIISSEPGQSHNTIGQAGGRAELRV